MAALKCRLTLPLVTLIDISDTKPGYWSLDMVGLYRFQCVHNCVRVSVLAPCAAAGPRMGVLLALGCV